MYNNIFSPKTPCFKPLKIKCYPWVKVTTPKKIKHVVSGFFSSMLFSFLKNIWKKIGYRLHGSIQVSYPKVILSLDPLHHWPPTGEHKTLTPFKSVNRCVQTLVLCWIDIRVHHLFLHLLLVVMYSTNISQIKEDKFPDEFIIYCSCHILRVMTE